MSQQNTQTPAQDDTQTSTQALARASIHSSIFTIKTEVFEGPLDLLLTLIEKRKLFINDISLAKVTDEYIEHIKLLPDYSLGDRAQFIYIASTLLLVKAKSLLPTLSLTDDEKIDIEDLERRLKELELMRRASEDIKKQFGSNIIHARGDFKLDTVVFAPGKDITLSAIGDAIGRVLNSLPKKKPTEPEIRIRKTISLEEMIGTLTERIQTSIRMSFREFSNRDKAERVHVIVSFLAMLELVKQGVIEARQEGLFNDIHMENQNLGVPKYS